MTVALMKEIPLKQKWFVKGVLCGPFPFKPDFHRNTGDAGQSFQGNLSFLEENRDMGPEVGGRQSNTLLGELLYAAPRPTRGTLDLGPVTISFDGPA